MSALVVAIKPIQEFQASLPVPTLCPQPESCLRIEFGYRLGGKLFEELVKTRAARRRQSLQTLMLIIRQPYR
jgi:hypothetical protein